MKTIFIDGDLYADSHELHEALKRMLALPDYYGCNADALNDCVSSMSETVNACIVSTGSGSVASTVELVCRVLEDNGGSVRSIG